ncbi:glycosyltransferase, partial [Escherichia coli]|nr:glycosyltransferase [Escherichia coli]
MKTENNNERLLIVVLNWNGAEVTLDCCKSLLELTSNNYDVLIIDNNSVRGDYIKLELGLKAYSCDYFDIKGPQIYDDLLCEYLIDEIKSYNFISEANFILMRSSINHGFARGCNLGAKYALKNNYENVLFLNNDTLVENDFLSPLLLSLKQADAVIPQIRYCHDKSMIWNCGGDISMFGSRKYFFANKKIQDVVFPSVVFPVTFATGCCILFRTDYFIKIGMFSEQFFFGEEDIELALRLKKKKSNVVCNTESIIYHKVGASIQGDPERILRKAYIHYLNRFINMKFFLGKIWYLWIIPSTLKI